MSNEEMRRRNNNNRKRGGKFEKTSADYFCLQCVPYSGSNARFGYGDITDDYYHAHVLGECKNFKYDTPSKSIGLKRMTVKRSWLIDITDKAFARSAMPFLAFMATGSPFKFVMLPEKYITSDDRAGCITCPRPNITVVNFSFYEDELICALYKGNIPYCTFEYDNGDRPFKWGIMSFPEFKIFLDKKLNRTPSPPIPVLGGTPIINITGR